jgi:hypothetical protein
MSVAIEIEYLRRVTPARLPTFALKGIAMRIFRSPDKFPEFKGKNKKYARRCIRYVFAKEPKLTRIFGYAVLAAFILPYVLTLFVGIKEVIYEAAFIGVGFYIFLLAHINIYIHPAVKKHLAEFESNGQMAFCGSCGQAVHEAATACPLCGALQYAQPDPNIRDFGKFAGLVLFWATVFWLGGVLITCIVVKTLNPQNVHIATSQTGQALCGIFSIISLVASFKLVVSGKLPGTRKKQ